MDGGGEIKVEVLGSVEETVEYVKEMERVKRGNVNVLVVGSLHLVWKFLCVLEPKRGVKY